MIHTLVIGFDIDPFDFDAKFPKESHALDSSLWELQLLAQHYNPTVSGLVMIFEDSLSKPSFDMEDFLDQSYFTLIETELKSRAAQKSVPAISIGADTKTFGSWIFQ
jgi:U3 small nucleolar RNA-associated protein 19